MDTWVVYLPRIFDFDQRYRCEIPQFYNIGAFSHSHLHVQIENIIADVPFVAVGLLGFGVITFFLVMKQAKL